MTNKSSSFFVTEKDITYDANGNILTFLTARSMVFSCSFSGTAPAVDFESTEFSAGRMVKKDGAVQPEYHVNDYLCSVRVVTDADGEVLERNDYSGFGKRLASSAVTPVAGSANRYRFSGKEEQGFAGVPWQDFGARMYDPDLARWTTPDPLAEKYPGISPYVYCNDNPVNFVDPDGRNPIYNRFGTLLGTDDGGLHGKALFMDDADFVQGMKQDDALLHDKGIEFLESEDAIDSFQANYTSLSERPDWDGEITLEEANEWYGNGNGQPLFADINKIDLPVWMISKDSPVGQKQVVNTLFGSIRSWLVYGKITLKHYPDNGVRAYSDNYGFEMKKPWLMHLGRNIETIIGSMVAGQGEPYNIHIFGIKYL